MVQQTMYATNFVMKQIKSAACVTVQLKALRQARVHLGRENACAEGDGRGLLCPQSKDTQAR